MGVSVLVGSLGVVGLLAGCGQKGPLTLPPDAAASA
ncbi:MAG: lipoprotein, partial [Rubrivivax sp.]|nr:lipoprotein [Rubrivivax sp.]